MNISDNDIIRTARQLRDQQNARLHVPQNPLQRTPHGHGLWWAAAACVACFVAGFALRPLTEHPTATQTAPPPVAVATPEPSIVHVTVHDTVFLTHTVTREVRVEVPVASPSGPMPEADETIGCSALCDDIDYNLLATN